MSFTKPLDRRSLLAFAGLSVAATSLTACAGGTSGGGSGQEGDGTLQFWSNHPGGKKELEEEMVKAWNKANPDTPAKLITAGADYEELGQKFNAALSGGDLPDVILASDVTWFNFALNEQTEPLDDLWKEAGVKTDDYVDSLLKDYELEGKHYGMPYCRSTCLMYFNSEHLEKAGLPTDRGPETWEEFEEWAPKLKKVNGGKPALALPSGTDYLDWYFQGMVWAFGGALSEDWKATFTKKETLEAGKFLQKQVEEGNISIEKDASNVFGLGNASGLLQSTGSLGGLQEAAKFDFMTAFLPGPGPSCPTGGAGMAMPSGISDERKKTAVKFMEFMTNAENTVKFTQATGYMPVRKSALELPEEQKYLEENPNAKTAIDQLEENTKSQDAARVFVPGGGSRIGGALDRITTGGEDVEKVFKELNEETQRKIDSDITPLLK
ncbi:sn-glycerol 3-phosphate transport system substrate-binding protein [Micrococcus cohnii]|uniref:sn-glycerol 3-phosphate transport system substrate-binding protein n=1 Tax=Micrococcus cohnii TaxID=993416 RepID=A0A7W7GPN4_9MICC|nr:ABC transporter substrate-binding protein [Micrococcus cohnii]MBB4735989.1 sn-glycerol 3-phosphate transport system substrate-binding protein [Micrococcus cohnii]